MGELTDIIILELLGICFSMFGGWSEFTIIACLVALIFSMYRLLYQRYSCLTLGYLCLCCLSASFLFFLPCLFYVEIADRKWNVRYLLFLGACVFGILQQPTRFLSLFLMVIAWIQRVRYIEGEELKNAFIHQRDNTKELANLLEEKNKDLIIRQDQEIKIATLHERNRIAREIHDHVGHLLSSSLLQVGAIQAISESDTLTQPLMDLRTTISSAMDNVRSSVHDLHGDVNDLQIVLAKLCKDFTFCEIKLEYDILHPVSKKQYYHILAIVKESMTNTMKHSNASLFTLTLREQPVFYQLIMQDNGTQHLGESNGIGLCNIQDRVEAMHGYCNIQATNGFLIFITMPKEENA